MNKMHLIADQFCGYASHSLRSTITQSVMLLFALSLVSGVANAAVGTRYDADGDGIVDTIDIDDDNDGLPDVKEIAVDGEDIDSDRDGIPDRLDLDSDNDGILDLYESGVLRTVGFSPSQMSSGRILDEVGINGLADALESPVDSGQVIYNITNSDAPTDSIPDFRDLDSDNDGVSDMREAGVDLAFDSDRDARIDAPVGTVGDDGIADRLQLIKDQTCCDITRDGIEDTIPRNNDNQDFPNYQDLDSDNDGVSDLIETGGIDDDQDGRVDQYYDLSGEDGMDDAKQTMSVKETDLNGNGLADYLDEFIQVRDGQDVTGEPVGTTDSGSTDSGGTDSGSTDSGSTDSGGTDSGGTDSGGTDSGSTTAGRDPVDRPQFTTAGTTTEGTTTEGTTTEGTTTEGTTTEGTTTEGTTTEGTTTEGTTTEGTTTEGATTAGDGPFQDDPDGTTDSGVIKTGLSASGCTVTSASTGSTNLLMVLMFSVMALVWRRKS